MKKIIDGRTYDTETAKQVGEPWSPAGFGPSDFEWYEETLYRKRTGEYFLCGQGGPMSRYAEAYGQSGWTGGERIMPLTYDEAREWAEQHMDADAYIAAFGDPGEGGDSGNIVKMTVRVPESTIASLDRMVSATGRGKEELVAEALAQYLQQETA